MRVLHIVHQFPPDHVGGTELYTKALAQAQARRSDEVAVVTPGPGDAGDHAVESAEQGVAVFRLGVGERGGTAVFRSTFGDERLAHSLAEVIDGFRPEVVHIQHLMGLPLDAVDLLRARGIPYLISLHDYWYRCANAQLLTNYDQTLCAGPDQRAANCGRCAVARAGLPGNSLLGPLVAPIMRRRNALLFDVFSSAAAVIAPNDFVRSTYATLGLTVDRMVVRPWGLDVPADLAQIRQTAARARATRPAGPLRLAYIGGLSRQKGIHVLIDAVNALPDGAASLDIYGNTAAFPDYVSALRQQARHPGIAFRGPLARSDFWPRLAALDALVLPTLWYETFSLAIDEAFAVQVPVIGSDIGALPFRIRDGIDGRLFPAGDTDALATLLLGLWQDAGQLARLREGIGPVKTMDNHASEIADLYAHVLRAAWPET